MTDSNAPSEREQMLARITDLEVKVAFQDRTIEDLDGVVREYTEKIEELTHQLELLRKSMADTQETGPANEKPPHY